MSLAGIYRTAKDDIPAVAITDKCVVLDLDLTLVSTQDNMDSLKQLGILSDPSLMSLRNRIYYITIEDLEGPGAGTKHDFWGITRPHLQEFLLFCFSYFKVVAVWSAGLRPYVEMIVDHIFKDLPRPHYVFTRDDITTLSEGYVIKSLEKIIGGDLSLGRLMSLSNTFTVDDNSSTFIMNPGNGILIPPYEPALNVNAFGRDDPTLLQLKYWFLQPFVVNVKDVRKLVKEDIFATSVAAYQEKLRSIPGYKFQ